MIPISWIKEAEQRIAPHIRRTPLVYDTENDLYKMGKPPDHRVIQGTWRSEQGTDLAGLENAGKVWSQLQPETTDRV